MMYLFPVDRADIIEHNYRITWVMDARTKE